MRLHPIILILLFFVQVGLAQQLQLFPKDESGRDSTLAAFVMDLKKAIAAKDEKWIYSVLETNVSSSYGGDDNVEYFIRYWNPENDSSDFWPSISHVLDLGGVYLQTTGPSDHYQFVFPYVYASDLNLDNEEPDGVITGKNVNLRSRPDIKSKVIALLTYDVIYFLPIEEGDLTAIPLDLYGDPEWVNISTFDRKYTGWVNHRYVYSFFGPRLFLFKDEKDQWKVSAFIEGD